MAVQVVTLSYTRPSTQWHGKSGYASGGYRIIICRNPVFIQTRTGKNSRRRILDVVNGYKPVYGEVTATRNQTAIMQTQDGGDHIRYLPLPIWRGIIS
jgi:hypothetical protein